MGGLNCFNDNDALARNSELHPVCRDGRRRPQMNWYIGITPTYSAYAHTRLDALEQMAQSNELDGVWLDFIRWPLHWEVELRADTPAPLESSFDAHTLRRFADDADVDLPAGTTSQKADWILRTHRDKWIEFKCRIITDFVARAKGIVARHLDGKPLGLDLVPAKSPQRELLLGQRLAELSAYADYMSPMLYHHVLSFSPDWLTETIDEMAAETDKPLVPFVQVDAFAGEEEPFSTREWEEVLHRVLSHERTSGLIAFTGEMLHAHGRGRNLGNLLRRQAASSA